MTIARVAYVGAYLGQNGSTSGGITTTGATLLTVGMQWSAAAGTTPPGLSDSYGNTWTARTPQTGASDNYTVIYDAKNPTVGTGHTVTVGTANSYANVHFEAWSGTDTSAPFDVQNGASGSGFITSLQTGSVTPGAAGELIVTILSAGGANGASIDTGFSTPDHVNGAYQSWSSHLIQTSASAVNPTWSWSGANAATTCIATYKAAAAAPSGGPRVLPLLGGGLTSVIAGKAFHMYRSNKKPTRRDFFTLRGKD